MRARLALLTLPGAAALHAGAADTTPQAPAAAADSRAVMTGDQVKCWGQVLQSFIYGRLIGR